jgi:hypothetical protein
LLERKYLLNTQEVGMLPPDHAFHRIVLEYQNALEQRRPPWYLAPFLHLNQGAVFVLSQFRLLGLQALQPGDQQRIGRQAHAHGERVDEQADHLRRPGQVGGPPGDRRAHDDILLATVSAEQQRPRPLHQRIHRQTVGASKLLQAGRGSLG